MSAERERRGKGSTTQQEEMTTSERLGLPRGVEWVASDQEGLRTVQVLEIVCR